MSSPVDTPPPPLVLIGDDAPDETTGLLQANQSSSSSQREENRCISSPLDVILPLTSCFIVPERRHVVQLYFGRYHSTITQPGCYLRFALGLEQRHVSTRLKTFEMHNTKIVDSTGSPVIISGIVTYEIADARRAAIDVNDADKFVADTAPAILKRVVSQFPYESNDPNVPSLRSETTTVAIRMQIALQRRVSVSGVRIDAFNINELSYAPEIAQAMLRRQQAHALIDARKAIVQGAKDIARDAISDISPDLSAEQKATLIGNLLLVLIGEKEVTPTLQL